VTHSHFSDHELIQLIKQRDADALEVLYDRHAQTIYNLISRIVRNRAIADDLLQETFWQVWQKAGDFSVQGSVGAWLYRIARNKSLDQLRRQKARPQVVPTDTPAADEELWSQLPAGADSPEQIADQRLKQEQLHQALIELPQEQRLCLELAYFEGMSQRTIAEYTDTPLGTVKTRMRIGLEKLERALRAAGYKPEHIT
jgi:RNA polymerase sigma-70 factor (ECF subfamily)